MMKRTFFARGMVCFLERAASGPPQYCGREVFGTI
jgi:hypothetical protein